MTSPAFPVITQPACHYGVLAEKSKEKQLPIRAFWFSEKRRKIFLSEHLMKNAEFGAETPSSKEFRSKI